MRRGLARLGRDTYWPALGYRCDEGLVEAVEGEWSRTELAQRVRAIGLQVHGGFASAAEQAAMVRELEEGPLRVLRWETGHWDAVISEYRETERLQWTAPEARAVLRRMRALFPRPWSWRPAAHVLDLRGDIGPHVDAVSIVGEVVCGLSLLSPAVMRFESDTEGARVCRGVFFASPDFVCSFSCAARAWICVHHGGRVALLFQAQHHD